MAKTFFFMGSSGKRNPRVKPRKKYKTTVITVGQRKIEKPIEHKYE